MITTFEYGEQFAVDNRKGLESYLCSLWKEYKEIWSAQRENENTNSSLESDLDSSSKYQPFLSFDGNLARARNYIGFIHFENSNIEICPKIFKKDLKDPETSKNKETVHRHLFYWFSYCKKVKFPFNQVSLDRFEFELPELILYLFAKQIHEIISIQPYSAYEEVQEALFTPRGRINFGRYAARMSCGNYHIIDCDYEPFIFDNLLNRTIKYCTRLLLSKTKVLETQRILNEIIFMLDEVDDQVCSVQQLKTIRIPQIYSDYEDVIQICYMILENQVYSYQEYELKNWSLLLPMEYIFEDFIVGYIQKHFSDIFKVEPQKSDLYLHNNPNAFNLKHDILLTNKQTGEQIIVDTKYKPRWNMEKCDPKKGIAQSDMYQMISYAYRRGTDKVLLIYPNTSEELADDSFSINNPLTNQKIKIKAIDVPFWSSDGHLFVEEKLKITFRDIFGKFDKSS